MDIHAGQFSLFELDQLSDESVTAEPNRTGQPAASSREAPSSDAPRRLPRKTIARRNGVPPAVARTAAMTPEANIPPAADRPGRTPLEKHYKTREVAELLSVHEETVLRLAQCGNLRSVRVGSERRYPESAIAGFLERNLDESPRGPRVARTRRQRAT
jgi:excisionase family DNA binding protein